MESTNTDTKIEDSFLQLQKIEAEIQRADAQVEQFKNDLFTPIYEKRRSYLKTIPKFWYIVLAQHEDFQEYVSVEDMKYIELISDLYVAFWDETEMDKSSVPRKGFTITVSFNSSESKDNKIKEQQLTKKFEWVIDPESGSRKLQSAAVSLEWPEELRLIDPVSIKKLAKDESRPLSSEEKKKYRQGMRSFFSFWQWTGLKPGKEYRNGEELATFIAEDIFPAALDYYVLAAPGLGENDDAANDEDDDEQSGEELDLSDPDDDEMDETDQKERDGGDRKRHKAE